jgi:hypothetical protein
MNQDQLAESAKIKRAKCRTWTLGNLPRDLAYRLAYNADANRWDLAVVGTVDEVSFGDPFTTR